MLDYDLARYRGREEEVREGIRTSSLVVVGSPVYGGHAAGPLMSFTKGIPHGNGKPALAYVSYGVVSKGSSLYRMAKSLDGLGYHVLGLAEVLATHSMMFRASNPLGKGRPGEEDREVLRTLVEELAPRLDGVDGGSMDYSAARPPRLIDRVLDTTFYTPRVMHYAMPPKRFRQDRCIDCGACRKACPVGRLDKLPVIDKSIKCLDCYSCVRSCEQKAFTAPMWVASPVLRLFSKVEGTGEKQATRCYIDRH